MVSNTGKSSKKSSNINQIKLNPRMPFHLYDTVINYDQDSEEEYNDMVGE